MNEFLTTQETAKLLNLDTMTLWRWRKEGMGPPYFKLTDSIKRPGHPISGRRTTEVALGTKNSVTGGP